MRCLLLLSGAMKVAGAGAVVQELTRLGYPDRLTLGIGILELACTLVYAIPRTAILGAILLTAYLGGPTATHVRIGDPFIPAVVVGIFVWGGLALRDARLRAFLPLRTRLIGPVTIDRSVGLLPMIVPR